MSYNLQSILRSVNAIVLTIALVMSNNLQAQENNQASSLLWEITGKKVKSPSYLMGTMHLIPKDKFYFPDDLREKVSETKLLVMEIGGMEEQMKAAALIMLKDGNLFDHFSQPQKDTLFQYLQTELEMDSSLVKQQFGRVKPFALLQLMTRSAFGENPESYELTLQGIAMQKNIPIKGLETVEDQMAVFDNMGMEEQVEMVMSSIRNSENSADEMNELIEIYLSQDIEALYALMSKEGNSLEKHEGALLTDRNTKWIPVIKKLIKKQPTFIAVGAAHLGGPNGVVELLKKEGYTVTPIQM